MTEKPKIQPRKRGPRDAVIAILAAAMIMSPSYLAYILLNRFNVGLQTVAVLAMAVFLVGVFLLVNLLKA
jgi:hypothetical protein